MLTVEPLGMKPCQWQFLTKVEAYIQASPRTLVPESTRRQFATACDILARLNGSQGEEARRGILLADDVGLGKTTVAALVAWIVASAGERRVVRILAPNDVMARRWEEELKAHVVPLQRCAKHIEASDKRVKLGRVKRLAAGSIQIVKHSYATPRQPIHGSDTQRGATKRASTAPKKLLECDLLIIDEAHRAKGEGTAFSAALKREKKHARRVLILTATPFSIRLKELERMLALIGGETSYGPVRAFSRALDELYQGDPARSSDVVARRLADRALAAMEALGAYVIRHGVEDLSIREQGDFGARAEWSISVPPASPNEIEVMLRMDRALRLAKDQSARSNATNDPRFHVGWQHLDRERAALKARLVKEPELAEPNRSLVKSHLAAIQRLRADGGSHSKMQAVGKSVCEMVEQGEKVVLFCHHHATAQELTAHLASVLPAETPPQSPSPEEWSDAWSEALPVVEGADDTRRANFIDWLCSDRIRAQTARWFRGPVRSAKDLVRSLRTNKPRAQACVTVVEAAQELYRALLQSRSSQQVLKDGIDHLPGAGGAARVLGVCEPSDSPKESHLFIHNREPDTVITIFNSPFGPEALVVTDKLSEGIDLHRYCRYLIHYELDPSPIRTVQRNGRLRRVNSWAATTRQPLMISYPAFFGTRDHRLVQIMKKRLDSFSLLLGGVQDFDVDEVIGSEESWRNGVIAQAKSHLEGAAGCLRARAR